MTENNLDESQVISNLMRKCKNQKVETKKRSGTHFSRKLDLPKHIYGYKTINLFETKKAEAVPYEEHSQIKLNDPFNIQCSHLQR